MSDAAPDGSGWSNYHDAQARLRAALGVVRRLLADADERDRKMRPGLSIDAREHAERLLADNGAGTPAAELSTPLDWA
jgi:hypothetical protein